MAKLSIILPSRDEKFLTPTIDDIFRNCHDEQTEVIAVLDSDKWPGDWKEVTDRHPRLHTIHNGSSKGMRYAINAGVASAISRGAKYVAKFDGHCSFSEGFDVELMSNCDEDWIVVPRRGRLDPEAWTATDTHKPDIDYHYLSFPDDPNDFGGPGLNGKPWTQRAIDRADILIDDEMSSQGSGWFMHAAFFQRIGFMDEASYGPFWNEFQELGLCAWLSGGSVKVNKKCRYLHLHKGSKHGRGYHLPERWLTQGRNHTMLWPWNEAWDSRQTRPFKWLIEHFWPVPSWPENWEELLYATRKPRALLIQTEPLSETFPQLRPPGLVIHSARYGPLGAPMPFREHSVDVAEMLRCLIKNNSLDVVVNNSTLTPGQNLYRGKKKVLLLTYSIDGGEPITIEREEKDWLIIGPVQQQEPLLKCAVCGTLTPSLMAPSSVAQVGVCSNKCADKWTEGHTKPAREMAKADNAAVAAVSKLASPESKRAMNGDVRPQPATVWVKDDKWKEVGKFAGLIPMTPAALNDYLIRKFSISPQRLRGPMPIEVPQFHRNDLAQLFAELGFKRGAEIGVAEGNYSEILLKANPECELLLVDPWHHYSENPQGKSKERHEFAYNETVRKTAPYPNVRLYPDTSMAAIGAARHDSLDFVYIDGNHLFDYVMEDLIGWSKCVRSGGIISGDDYYELDQKRWTGGGVVEAVQAYTKAHRIPIWWLFAGHKSVDFMWVKP